MNAGWVFCEAQLTHDLASGVPSLPVRIDSTSIRSKLVSSFNEDVCVNPRPVV